MRDLPFAMVPVEVAMDERLTLRHIRVLIALLSCRNRATNLICPSRETIAERTGLALTRISTVTSELVELGWLEKEGNGGRSKACRYVFQVPDFITQSAHATADKTVKTVPESVTVTKSETVTDSVTKTVTDSVTKTVTDSGTGIEQTTEQTREQNKKHTHATCDHRGEPMSAAQACVILINCGIAQVNPSHPHVNELNALGASPGDYEFAGRRAIELGKGFGYALGIVRGLLRERRQAAGVWHGENFGGQRGTNRKSGGNSRIEHSRRLGEHLDRCIEAEFGAGVDIGVV